MHLLIDQGNTKTKYFVVNANDEIVFQASTADADALVMKQLVDEYAVTHTLVSSVKAEYETLSKVLGNENITYFNDDCLLPITNLYTTPKTLGKDRIAGVCGAAKLFPQQNCLVIDAGTCITYDFIDAEKKYLGGNISPGLEMRLKAMHTFTGKLPQAPLEWVDNFIGNSTQTCLQTGALQGAVNEIDGFIKQYQNKFGSIKTLMCGGNSEFLANRCESEIFAAPNLVIIGLNEILKQNLPHVA